MVANKNALPENNLYVYQLLYNIEVGLREFIVETCSKELGEQWWKQRMPSDVKDNAKKGLEAERAIKWSELIPYHIIYYTDFPDLKKIIIKGDNWKDFFQAIFQRDDILKNTLSELEPIRNKVAHNRKITQGEVVIVESAYHKIITSIGESYFFELTKKCSLAEDILKMLTNLQNEAVNAFRICKAFQTLTPLFYWDKIRKSWWFDDEYLGCEITSIKNYFNILYQYAQIPRFRGNGHEIEAWLKNQYIDQKYCLAEQEFIAILKRGGKI